MKLKIFNDKSYTQDTIMYDIVYLDEPFLCKDRWYNREDRDKNLIFSINWYLFDEVFLHIFNKFDFFDMYDISNFYSTALKQLQDLFAREIELNKQLTDEEFNQKYKLIFEDIKENKIVYEDVFEAVKSDIQAYLMHLNEKVGLAVGKNQCITILGI